MSKIVGRGKYFYRKIIAKIMQENIDEVYKIIGKNVKK